MSLMILLSGLAAMVVGFWPYGFGLCAMRRSCCRITTPPSAS